MSQTDTQNIAATDRLRDLAARAFPHVVTAVNGAGPGTVAAQGRRLLLAGVFHTMPSRLDPTKAAGIDGSLEWRIRDGIETSTWTTTISGGRCEVHNRGGDGPVRATLELAADDFLGLVSASASAGEPFMTGEVKVSGDLIFAASAAGAFRASNSVLPSNA
jgi:putative sterol carrier protein